VVKPIPRPSLPIYGLTGGIASGKSVAAGYLRELGIEVIDADAVARELRAPGGAAETSILAHFGTLDPALLRKKIAENPSEKKALEAILHPLIAKESACRFAALKQAPYAIYEAALLVEAGRAKDFTGLILVESSPELQLSRLVMRDEMDPVTARQFLGTQGPIEAKRAAATHHILNNGTLDDLRGKILRLHDALLRGEKSFSA
jgi:dephospho-CoA kinase